MLKAWGRLLRLSLAPSAAADIAAGVVLGAHGWIAGAAPWRMLLASLCVYHGGMALNDWADRDADARRKRGRPLQVGTIQPFAAAVAGLGLLALGVLLAPGSSPSALLAWVVALVLIYDLAPRREWSGPLLLALCRAGNLACGIALGREHASVGSTALQTTLFASASVYGLYVFLVGCLGRLEDVEDERVIGRTPSFLCLGLGGVLVLAPWCAHVARGLGDPSAPPEWTGLALGELLALAGAIGLWRVALPLRNWSASEVMRTMGLALRRLLVFSAALALSAGGEAGWIVALAILAGYPLSWWLRGVFPPS